MYLLLIILIVIAAMLMCFIVLIQNSKGGGLASGFSSCSDGCVSDCTRVLHRSGCRNRDFVLQDIQRRHFFDIAIQLKDFGRFILRVCSKERKSKEYGKESFHKPSNVYHIN